MSKLLKIIGTLFLGLMILLGGFGYYFIRNFDLNQYKSYAEDLVQKELGRKLAIKGEASIGISLVPTLVIENVELANATWAKNPQMIKIKKLEIKFAVLPLLKKQIVIDKIVLDAPEAYLEVAKNGQASWDFASSHVAKDNVAQDVRELNVQPSSVEAIKENPELALLAGFAAKSVVIENGLVEFDDQKNGSQQNVVIKEMNIGIPNVNSAITAYFDVIYNKQKITGQLVSGSIEKFVEAKEAFPINLNATALGIDVDINGSVEDVMKNPRFAALTNIYNPAGNMGAPETTLKAMINGNMNQVSADIELLNIVNNVIAGKVMVNIAGRTPYIEANLHSDKINLESLQKTSNFAVVLPALINEAQALSMVPDTQIPFGDLNKVNAKLDVKIKQLIVSPAMKAENVDMKATLQSGVLNVNPLKLNLGGGELDAYLIANAANQSVDLKLTSKNMLLQNLHQEFKVENNSDFGVLSGGKIDLDINVKGSGPTYRQLVDSFNGVAIAIVNPSVIQTGSLNFMTGNFLRQLMTALRIDTRKNSDMNIKCAVVRADLGGGRAVFPKGIALDSSQLMLVSDGNINLINDKIDFGVSPFSGKVMDTNVAQALSSFVRVKGTLENPKITIDDKEAFKAVVGVVATGGTAYIGSKLLLDANSSPCYTALLGTPYQNRFPKPTGVQAEAQDVYQGTTKAVEDTTKAVKKDLKALEGVAKDFLGSFKKRF